MSTMLYTYDMLLRLMVSSTKGSSHQVIIMHNTLTYIYNNKIYLTYY